MAYWRVDRTTPGSYRCFRRHSNDCANKPARYEYDSKVFENQLDAERRCRALNEPLIPKTQGWLSDGHPQNW